MLTGIVKWFDPIKGYGVLESPGKGEFFMHVKDLVSNPTNIKKGSVIIFSESVQKKSSKKSAEKCKLIAESGDLDAAMFFLGKDAEVSIEVTVKGKSRHGNPFQRKERRSVSVLEFAIKQVFRELGEEDIVNKITDYFDKGLDKNYFLIYCEVIEVCLSELLGVERAKISLARIFNHFGKNLDERILFLSWKEKKFRYIAYNGFEDYEIPEEVLLQNVNEIGFKELQRIQSYSYAESLTAALVSSHLGKLHGYDIKDLLSLYPVLDFASDEKDKFKHQLDSALAAKTVLNIIGKAEELPIISDDQGFSRYFALRYEIPRQLEDNHTASIEDKVNQIICSKAAPEYHPVLWLKGLIKNLPANAKMSYFLSQETSAERRTQTLRQMESAEQITALKKLSEHTGPSEVYRLLERYLSAANHSYEYNLPETLFNETFWVNKQGAELVTAFKTFVEETASPEQKYDLFFIGYYNRVPLEILLKDAKNLPPDKFKKAISVINDEGDLIIKLLLERVSEAESSDITWIVQLGKQTLKEPVHESFSRHLFDTVAADEYFSLWEEGLVVVVPEQQINKVLNDNYATYKNIAAWCSNSVISTSHIISIMLSFLKQDKEIEDRASFYKHLNHIRYFSENFPEQLDSIISIGNRFYMMVLWYFDQYNNPELEVLKDKFIYFQPDDQVKIIKKLFHLIALDQTPVDLAYFQSLSRFDLDLYKKNLDYNPQINVDISTEVLIQALMSYNQKQAFLVEDELLSFVLKAIEHDKSQKFKIGSYFEDCQGRMLAEHNWATKGNISKIRFNNNKFYFAISFSTGETRYVRGREIYTKNEDFDMLKDAVKLLPGARWNSNDAHWGIPAQHEKEVLEFAREFSFFLDLDGNNYTNNLHLVNYKRKDIPSGITFCEGRAANKIHNTYKKDFWWCAGQACFERCENNPKPEEWTQYTLLDFCKILRFDTDETTVAGKIPNGKYYQFISLVNRFNRLLEKIYCRDCGHMLSPAETSNYAVHTVVRFCCTNDSCHNKETVYLNHCLNGQCNSIIDSRDSKKCSNGLYICDNCGSCCSHQMLKRRLDNLEVTGGYIHESLRTCVDKKLGHLERGTYSCHKCANAMLEIAPEIFKCRSCDNQYDTTRYRFQRPHKHLAENPNDSEQQV